MSSPGAEELYVDHHRPWSDLPLDLLKLISTNLIDVADYLNFRGVCTAWRSGSKPTHLPMLPLVLLPHDPNSDSLSFFHLPTSKIILTSQFPEIRNQAILGSSFGWLALASFTDSSLSLFNPFTRSQIHLPPLLNLGPSPSSRYYSHNNSKPFGKFDETDIYCRFQGMNSGHPWKASFSKNPSDEDGCIVAVTLTFIPKFAICRFGQTTNKWMFFDTTQTQTYGTSVYSIVPQPYDFVFLNDSKFYILDRSNSCYVIDIMSGSNELKKIPPPEHSVVDWRTRLHIVKVDGQLFLVAYVRSKNIQKEGQQELRVFKLGWVRRKNYSNLGIGEQLLRWSEVSSIGEYAIFLSGTHSCAVQAAEFRGGCRKDCIYFSAVYGSSSLNENYQPGVHYMDVFDMKDHKFKQISCPWAEDWLNDTWITPCIR